MKTKHTFLATASFPLSNKNRLRQFIRLALVGSVMVSNMAFAALQDHGPQDPVLTWPQWYRDTNGLAIGMCNSTSLWCFPPAPVAVDTTLPPALQVFPGNIGPEKFYNMVEFKDPNANAQAPKFQYHYLAGLEASYLPAGDPVHGTETVFARIRISFNFTDVKNEGTYTVTHPFGVTVFPDVKATTTSNFTGNQAAVFFTADVPLGPAMNFDLATAGPLGPFIQWTDMPVGGLPGPIAGEQFVGDPTVTHAFTGSPFKDSNGAPQNYLKIEGPVGADLGNGTNVLLINEANVIGQIWTAPIAENLKIDAATMTRSSGASGVNGIDVWATSSPSPLSVPKQNLILTASGMPSLQLFADGTTPGKYHGHIEYPSSQPVPSTVMVTDLTSNPVVSASAALVDGVEISRATFGLPSRNITVVADTTDHVALPSLVVQGIPGVASGVMTQALCAGITVTDPVNDVCFVYNLPAAIEPPESLSVLSSEQGHHTEHLLSVVDNGAAVVTLPATPTSLTAVLNTTGNGIALSWTDNSTNENNFTVLRSDNGASAVLAGTVTRTAAQSLAVGGAAVTFNDTTGLVVGHTYTYYVIANKTTPLPASSSAHSATAAFTISAPVIAAPGKPTVVQNPTTATSANISWVDNSNNETGFVVMRSDNGTTAVQVGTATSRAGTGGTVTFTNTGLVEGHTYTYSVIANKTTAFAGQSAASAPTPYSQPLNAPTAVNAAMAQVGTGVNATDTATVTWTDNSAAETSYTVQYSGSSAGTATRTGTVTGTGTRNVTLPIPNLSRVPTTNLPTYTFTVKAVNATGTSVGVSTTARAR